MNFSMIVAVDEKLGIGKNNSLPWRLPSDLKFFKQKTLTASAGKKNAVIMGRKTWDSLPEKVRPLPGRVNIVVSRQKELDLASDALLANSLAEALELCSTNKEVETVFVIGGSSLFKEGLEHRGLERVYLTSIHSDYACDCYFPDYEQKLNLLSQSELFSENGVNFCFKVLEAESVAVSAKP